MFLKEIFHFYVSKQENVGHRYLPKTKIGQY